MSAAVSTMQHQPGAASNPTSRMGTSSPVDKKKTIHHEDSNRPNITTKVYQQSNTSAPSNSVQSSQTAADRATDQATSGNDPSDLSKNEGGTPNDYFSMPRPNRLDQEPNPFEQSFRSTNNNNNGESMATPKAILPPVTAMTSPALPMGESGGYNWGPHSLRSGPLSPAMLQGPTSASAGLGFEHIRSGLTPNESGIRSGLTPGGSGTMFPAPSPSTSQFLFGGSTPGTMEFQKTAISAARKSHPGALMQSHPQDMKVEENNNISGNIHNNLQHSHKPRQPSDAYNADPAHNAANGLYMLAQLGGAPNALPHMSSGMQPHGSTMETSPNLAKRVVMNNAQSANAAARNLSNSMANNTRGVSEMSNDRSGSSQEPEPSNGRKGRSNKGKGASTGKRKNDEFGAGGNRSASNKKNKGARSTMSDDMMEDDEDMDEDQGDGLRKDGKKMTDEEKRKNFLERNRVAALKCRQRKKQWLANLQAKVEMFGSENDALNATVQGLREEIVALKTLLLAHKDCPVARANGVNIELASMPSAGDYHVPMMTGQGYAMMPAGVIHQQQADRRYS